MKQAIHLFKKDLRRFRPMIVILLIFLALHVWLLWRDPLALSLSGFVNHSGESRLVVQDNSQIHAILYLMLTVILYLMLMVMTVLLIHEDPPAGKPFWQTRPISIKSLLASKCGFLFLFGVVAPVIANFVVLFHYGLQPQLIVASLIDVLSLLMGLLSVFFAIAVVAPDPSSFVMAVLVWIVLFILGGYRSAPEPLSLQTYLSCWQAIAVSFVVIVHQYLTRRRALSAMIFIAGMLLISGTDWDRYIVKTYRAWVTARDPEINNLRLAFLDKIDSKTAVIIDSSLKNTPGKRNLIMGLEFSNIPPDSAAELLQLKGMIIYKNGAKIPLVCIGTGFNDETLGSRIALRPNCQVDETVFEKSGNLAGDFSGEAIFKLIHYTTVGRLPLKQGSYYQKGSQFLSVYRASYSSNSIHIVLMSRSLVSSRLNLWAPITTLEGNPYPELAEGSSFTGSRMLLFGGPIIENSGKSWGTYPAPNPSAFDVERISRMGILIRNKTETGPFVRKFEAKNIHLADYTPEALINPNF
jgi:hypothetical protein